MDTRAFEDGLRRDGFTEVLTRSVRPGEDVPEHTHDFEVRALVLDGEITLTADGRSTRFGPGEVFTMRRGHPHEEQIGPDGVRFLVGRRRD